MVFDNDIFDLSGTVYMVEKIKPVKVYHSVNKKTGMPVTVIEWSDHSKTMVSKMEGEENDEEKALAMCFAKKVLGSEFKKFFKENTLCQE